MTELELQEQKAACTRFIAELKAKRVAELAAAEEARRKEAEEKERQHRENFDLALFNAFAKEGCPELWVLPHVTREAGKWEKLSVCEVDYDFPGHLVVTLVMVNNATRSGFGDWRTALEMTRGELPTWKVEGCDTEFDNLADALIRATTGE